MTLSTLWARFCALFVTLAQKGELNLQLADGSTTTAAPASLDSSAAPGALLAPAADGSTATASAALAGPAQTVALLGAGDQSAVLLAGQVAGAAVQSVLAAAAPAAAVVLQSVDPALSGADPKSPADSDDAEDEDGAELDTLKALTGGSDLYLSALKDLVSFAMDLGHDLDTAFDAAATRLKARFSSL